MTTTSDDDDSNSEVEKIRAEKMMGEEPLQIQRQTGAVTDSMKSILTNLTDDGLDHLWDLIPTLTEEEVNFRDKNGNGWLHWLSVSKGLQSVDQNRLVGLVYALSAAGINYNMRNLTKNTALHFAVACSAPLRMINALLKIGIDPSFANEKGNKAVTFASSRSVVKTLEMFAPPLDEAIREGDMEQVTRLTSYWVRVTNYHLDVAKKHAEIRTFLEERQPVVQLVHRCLAGDTAALAAAIEKNAELQLNITDESYVNEEGVCLRLPLLFQLTACPYTSSVAELLLEKTRPDVTFPVKFKADGKMVPFWISFRGSNHPKKATLMPLIQNCVNYKASLEALDHEIMLEFLHTEPDTFDHLIRMGYPFWKPDAYLRNLMDHAALWQLRQVAALNAGQILASLTALDEALLPQMRAWSVADVTVCMNSGYWPCIGLQTVKRLRGSALADDKALLTKLEAVNAVWMEYRRLRQLISLGNTAAFKDSVTPEVCTVTDKKGQSLAHIAVIYERRFILKQILEKNSESVDLQDYEGRTALHYSQGLDEAFIHQFLIRAGANTELTDNRVATALQASDPGAARSHYRQAIRAERLDPSAMSLCLLLLQLGLQDAVDRNDPADVELLLTDCAWPDLPITLIGQLNRIFPRQPHRFPNLVGLCIDLGREDIGCRLLEAGILPPMEATRNADGTVRRAEERALEIGLSRLANEIARLRQDSAPGGEGDPADEVGTILSVDTMDTFAVPPRAESQHRRKKQQQHAAKSKTKGKKPKGKAKSEEGGSEVCVLL